MLVNVNITQILSECSGLDGTEDYYSSQNEENEDKNRYSQILPSKLKSTPLQTYPDLHVFSFKVSFSICR